MSRKSNVMDIKKRNLSQEIKDAKFGDVIIWPCDVAVEIVDKNKCPICGGKLKSGDE